MRRWLLACLALPLAGCTPYGAEYGYGAGYGAPVAYDGFYDDYYGPIYDGYWGGGGVFYYRTGARGRWRADRGGHFRREAGPGGFGPRGDGGPARPGGFGGAGPRGGPPPGNFHAFHANGPGPHMGGGTRGDHGGRNRR